MGGERKQAKRALEAIDNRPESGFNFTPGHFLLANDGPVKFIEANPNRVFHVCVRDTARALDGIRGIPASHLDFDPPGRGWNFRSSGHGGADFESIMRAFNAIGYCAFFPQNGKIAEWNANTAPPMRVNSFARPIFRHRSSPVRFGLFTYEPYYSAE